MGTVVGEGWQFLGHFRGKVFGETAGAEGGVVKDTSRPQDILRAEQGGHGECLP